MLFLAILVDILFRLICFLKEIFDSIGSEDLTGCLILGLILSLMAKLVFIEFSSDNDLIPLSFFV